MILVFLYSPITNKSLSPVTKYSAFALSESAKRKLSFGSLEILGSSLILMIVPIVYSRSIRSVTSLLLKYFLNFILLVTISNSSIFCSEKINWTIESTKVFF